MYIQEVLFMKNKEKLKVLLQDEDFIVQLLDMQTPREVQNEFKKHEVDISLEEVAQLSNAIDYMIEEGKDELSEDDLKNVAGGNEESTDYTRYLPSQETMQRLGKLSKNFVKHRKQPPI